MTAKANAIKTLYIAKKITIKGVQQAVANKIITSEEYLKITGENYPAAI